MHYTALCDAIDSKSSWEEIGKMASFEKELEKANRGLSRVAIRVKGNRLYLRATLPLRNDNAKTKSQEIATGCTADVVGLKPALAKAMEIQTALMWGKDVWAIIDGWVNRINRQVIEEKKEGRKELKVEDAIESYRLYYLSKHGDNPTTKDNYEITKYQFYKRLPQDQLLTKSILVDVLCKYPARSWGKSYCYIAFKCLIDYHKLPIDLSSYKDTYIPKLRYIPTLNEIETEIDKIGLDQWQFIAGMIATFGLRPHEIFYLDISRLSENPQVLQIDDKLNPKTKTGYRVIVPIHAEWIDRWELTRYRFPAFDIDWDNTCNRLLGARVKGGFRYAQFPYTAYQLRDFYAVYSSVLGIPNDLAARFMGHSLQVHEKYYKRHMDSDRLIEAYLQATKTN